MTKWVEVTDLGYLMRRKKQRVTVEGQDIALFYVAGQVFALNDVCVHKGRHLSRGLVFQGTVICPGHQWAFDLKTGWVDEWSKCQPTYEVKVESEKVYVNPEPHQYSTRPDDSERFQPEE